MLRAVAERGSFTAAAAELDYTQSAVSRSIAALERAAGARLFDRRPDGVRLTDAGRTLLRHAATVLEAAEAAELALRGLPAEAREVRIGLIPLAGAAVLPRVLAALRRTHPHVHVSTREGSTPALTRALRAQTLDLALLSARPPFRAPDDEQPPLPAEPLAEDALLLAVPEHSPLTGYAAVPVDALAGEAWIAGPSGSAEPGLGVWPGLPGRPRVAHHTRDWLSKLALVRAGCGITTVSALLAPAVPAGVRLLRVAGDGGQRRRLLLARPPAPAPIHVREVARCVRTQTALMLAASPATGG
ncbi:LysR family transcriptional regulator [Pseudosporangium ferrugineum]|uniref:DNA-binding transcriptional LysR family regulator n=1 Tax=Pseudosporangium ferrugineum TaxID=439699 RepID=A0A2T0SBJ0_9ACTN|nr:LysR family transcriptional regulator [Pseudosporangium ferrugineum]PRY30794.1 DNA-binding transcriptional LysR family regulator [Pseudosporangium ferrugineum]